MECKYKIDSEDLATIYSAILGIREISTNDIILNLVLEIEEAVDNFVEE